MWGVGDGAAGGTSLIPHCAKRAHAAERTKDMQGATNAPARRPMNLQVARKAAYGSAKHPQGARNMVGYLWSPPPTKICPTKMTKDKILSILSFLLDKILLFCHFCWTKFCPFCHFCGTKQKSGGTKMTKFSPKRQKRQNDKNDKINKILSFVSNKNDKILSLLDKILS